MKKVLMSIVIFLVSASAFADPALVIILDDGACFWGSPTTYSEGNVHFVLNDGDLWVLSCHGEVLEGELPDHAYVAISSDANPEHLCTTPFGSTYNVRSVTTPAGKSKLTCWGVPGG